MAGLPTEPADHAHLRRDPAGVSRRPDPGARGRRGPERHRAGGPGRARAHDEPRARNRGDGGAGDRVGQQRPNSGDGHDLARRATAPTAAPTLRWPSSAAPVIPATIGAVPGVHAYVAGQTAASQDFNEHDEGAPAARDRLRPRPRLPAAAGHVPLARDPAEDDRPQPALGGRRLRRRHPDLPGRLPALAARAPRTSAA